MDPESRLTDDEREAIVSTATDYIESWLDGDADRMRRCLHPRLAKRMVDPDPPSGELGLVEIDALDLIAATGEGHGTRFARDFEVTILDVHPPLASVKVRSVPYVDYLHLARFGDRWLVLNAVWERRPGYDPPR